MEEQNQVKTEQINIFNMVPEQLSTSASVKQDYLKEVYLRAKTVGPNLDIVDWITVNQRLSSLGH